MKDSDFTGKEFPPLNDVLQRHLIGCRQCRESLEERPTGFGQRTTLCSEWQEIITNYADQEGKVNNVVARTEYGYDAPRSANPHRPYDPR